MQIPEAGRVEAEIVWNSGPFFGCEFQDAISAAAVSAALLRSVPHSTEPNSELLSTAVDEVQALSARVRKLADKLDRALASLRRPDQR